MERIMDERWGLMDEMINAVRVYLDSLTASTQSIFRRWAIFIFTYIRVLAAPNQ